MGVLALDHVQLAAPAGCEPEARSFYGGLLGLAEIEKPATLRGRGGVWFALGEHQLHIGVEADFTAARKAHPALLVGDERELSALAERLERAGVALRWDQALDGVRRFYCEDPWGNRLELLTPAASAQLVRRGGPDDYDVLLGLFDGAVAWMLERNQPGQWGEVPPSSDEQWRARISDIVGEELWLIEVGGGVVGALAVGSAPDYVARAEMPELYIHLLITARSHSGEGLGHQLVEIAESQARARSAEALRVDCWALSPSLIGWYEGEGFVRCGTFETHGWPGQVFMRPVPYLDRAGPDGARES